MHSEMPDASKFQYECISTNRLAQEGMPGHGQRDIATVGALILPVCALEPWPLATPCPSDQERLAQHARQPCVPGGLRSMSCQYLWHRGGGVPEVTALRGACARH